MKQEENPGIIPEDPGTVLIDDSPSEFENLAAGPETTEEMPENTKPNDEAIEIEADKVDSEST